MSDEQIIYIGPEDDLTSIRERLEKVQSKQVTLVIPANTQLRSHVAWKLLYVRARELGKEVLIVSSDAQIRSVAHGVKFRVATSLEASSPARPRPTSRPGRAPAGAKPRSTSTGSIRSSSRAEGRSTGSISSTRTRTAGPWSQRADERPFTQSRPESESKSRSSQPDNMMAGEIEDLPIKRFGSSSYSSRSSRIDSIDSVPSIHPLPPEQSDEVPDYQIDEEDFKTAREIREAALGGRQPSENADEESEETAEYHSVKSQPSAAPRASNLPQIVDDPYAYMGDETPSRLPREQQGAVSMDHFNIDEHEIQDVPDTPTDDDDIEYQADTGVFLPASEAAPYEDEEEEIAGPSSSLHIRPHSSRPQTREDIAASHRIDDESDQDLQLPIEDLPTRVSPITPLPMSPLPPHKPAASSRRSGTLPPGTPSRRSGTLPPKASSRRSTPLQPSGGTSSRRSVPLQQPGGTSSRRSVPLQQPSASPRRSVPLQPGGTSSRRSVPLQQPTGRDRSAVADSPRQQDASRISQRPTFAPSASRFQGVNRRARRPVQARSVSRSNSGRGRIIILAAVILLVLLIGCLALFVPTATVVLTLQPHAYSHALSLVARSDTSQNGAAGVVASQLQTHTFTHSGTATASGTKQVGRAAASGSVTFTNNSQQPITIPTGTIVSTPSGIQFATQADLVVTRPGQVGNQVPVPIQAVNKGDSGNLPAGTITVIPQDSLNAIAKDNNISAADLTLRVSNDQPTMGGGLATVHTIRQQDLDAAKKNLLTQTQPAITDWLKQWTTNAVTSKPTVNATLVGSPQIGQIVDNTSVPVTLNATVSILVVANNDLQKAAVAQLDASLKNDPHYQDYTVPTEAQSAVKISAPKVSSNDATSLTINTTATAQVVRSITPADVRKEIAGMTSKAAQEMLSQQPGIERVDINVSPGADPWLPIWSSNTQVVLQVGATK